MPEILFIGGSMDGKRPGIHMAAPEIRFSRYSVSDLASFNRTGEPPMESDVETYYLVHLGAAKFYVSHGLSMDDAIASLLAYYKPPPYDILRETRREREDRALRAMINAAAKPPPQLICAECAAKLTKFPEFASQRNQSYGNCTLCHQSKYLREVQL